MSLRQADLHGGSGMIDRGPGACTRAAVRTRNGHPIGMCLRDASRDGSDTDLGDEFYTDLCAWIHVLEVEDQLG